MQTQMIDHMVDIDHRLTQKWCPICVFPTHTESAGPLGWIDRCTFNPDHWQYRHTSDPNTLDLRKRLEEV